MNFFKNKMTSDEKYQLIETQRKIYYFSKFSLDLNEFIEIFTMVKTVKENIFKNLLDAIKYCTKGKY
jgi:cystathionine beta-lyase family protein involved in aluminum resistance